MTYFSKAADPGSETWTEKRFPTAIIRLEYVFFLCREKVLDERSVNNILPEKCFMTLVITWVNQTGRTAFILQDNCIPQRFST